MDNDDGEIVSQSAQLGPQLQNLAVGNMDWDSHFESNCADILFDGCDTNKVHITFFNEKGGVKDL
jgi:hypothetical protein